MHSEQWLHTACSVRLNTSSNFGELTFFSFSATLSMVFETSHSANEANFSRITRFERSKLSVFCTFVLKIKASESENRAGMATKSTEAAITSYKTGIRVGSSADFRAMIPLVRIKAAAVPILPTGEKTPAMSPASANPAAA